MLVIPALDIHDGKCIRMRQGDLATAVICDEDPVRRARQFIADGATRLHVVDIDAAFSKGDNLETVARICRAVDVPVQVGGGIRNIERALQLVNAGARDIVLGTLLAEDEEAAARIVDRLRGYVIAAIDARGNQVATRGWRTASNKDRDALANRYAELGISRIIFTEIARDGTRNGFDVDALTSSAASRLLSQPAAALIFEKSQDISRRSPPRTNSHGLSSHALYATR